MWGVSTKKANLKENVLAGSHGRELYQPSVPVYKAYQKGALDSLRRSSPQMNVMCTFGGNPLFRFPWFTWFTWKNRWVSQVYLVVQSSTREPHQFPLKRTGAPKRGPFPKTRFSTGPPLLETPEDGFGSVRFAEVSANFAEALQLAQQRFGWAVADWLSKGNQREPGWRRSVEEFCRLSG